MCFLATLAGQAQTYTINFHSFAGKPNDGAFANGELTKDSAGNFYGTTEEGGANGFGTVFKMDPSGAVRFARNFVRPCVSHFQRRQRRADGIVKKRRGQYAPVLARPTSKKRRRPGSKMISQTDYHLEHSP